FSFKSDIPLPAIIVPRPAPQLPAAPSDSYPPSSLAGKCLRTFPCGKVTVTPPSERRSEGQEANGINGRGPLAGRRPFMPDCFLTAAERSGHQTPSCPQGPLWLRLRRARYSAPLWGIPFCIYRLLRSF